MQTFTKSTHNPPTIKTPGSDMIGAGVSNEDEFHLERLFDKLLNQLIIYRCEVSQNTFDGIHS
jgi:hypothetical protein